MCMLNKMPMAVAFQSRNAPKKQKVGAWSAFLAAVCTTLVLGTTIAAPAAEARSTTYNLDIPAQSLNDALQTLALAAQHKLLYSSELVDGKKSPALKGEFTIEQAVKALLSGTDLKYEVTSDGFVLIRATDAPPTTNAASADSADARKRPLALASTTDSVPTTAAPSEPSESDEESKPGFFHRFLRLAQAGAKNTPAPTTSHEETRLEEIIVTAQKRSEKLMEVPSSIGVLSGDRLESLQSYSLPDFAGYVPGLTVAAGGSPGQNMLVIRGLATGYRNDTTGPLVATYIDDVPVSSSSFATRGAIFGFDVMPYDIARVEVLRGPQGTLYGAAAMGGLVKYSLRKPDLTQFDAQVGTDVEDTNGSSHPGWGGRASVNLPVITDTLGMRASGFYQNNAGYIDNVGIGTRNANHSTESGGRVTVLWKPADGLSVQATILAQDIRSADQTGVTLNGTTFQRIYGPQARSTVFPEPFTQQARNYSLSVDWDLHFATLTNSSSWSRLDSGTHFDVTRSFGAYVAYPGALVLYLDEDKGSKFTEEMRLASPQNQRIQWMLGGFYTKEDGVENGSIPAFTPAYVPLPADNIEIYTTQDYFKERAIFGNATYRITDHFDIGGGARYAQNTEINCLPFNGGFFGSPSVPCASRPYVGVATWLADARFHLDPDSMFYLRWATGYRAGGCNSGSGCVTNIPLEIPGTFNPDKVANYEGGFKGEFFDHRLQLDLSAFHIDWRDIQVQVINSLGLGYTGNGGTATSNGFELTTFYQITDRLSLQATLDHTDAHLTQDAPGIGGKNGDQLPVSPRWSGSLTAEYRQPLGERRQFVLGGGYRYRDTVDNQFKGSGNPLPIGPQNIVDLYAGLVMNRVSGRLYAKNVFNNRSYMGLLNLADPQMPMFVPVQPRTIGLSLDYQFK